MRTQEAAGQGEQHTHRLSELLRRAVGENVETASARGVMISRITDDSRGVEPGACFVAIRGTHQDGARYVDDAVRRGAAAVIADRDINVPAPAVCVRVPDAARALARLAAVQEGLADVNWTPRRGLSVVGVTGTNGKSTFCCLVRAILGAAASRGAPGVGPTALLGTIQYDLLTRRIEAPMTTPPATHLASYLVEAAGAGATHAVMEVSSHALEQRRTDGIRFSVGVFTNLTGDHLDYHGTMEAYRLAKRRLFDGLDADATAVINIDDARGESMVEACAARVVRFGLRAGADVCGRIRSIDATGTQCDLITERREIPLRLHLIGRHNVQNALAAAAATRALGVDLESIVAGLQSVSCVAGRLQRVGGDEWPFAVLVDYAHTDDALENVLAALRPLTRGRLIVVFGCGGDRDRTKRPRMAEVAARWADRIIVTSDNPRSEDPARIIDDIRAGFPRDAVSRVHAEADRRRAIREAITSAESGDVVLLAGKGHENYQIIGPQRLHFDDAEVAAEVLAERRGATTPAKGATAA